MEMFRYPVDLTEHGLGITVDGRLYSTRLPEPEWLRRRYAHAQALQELRAGRGAMAGRDAAPRPGLAARMLEALGLA